MEFKDVKQNIFLVCSKLLLKSMIELLNNYFKELRKRFLTEKYTEYSYRTQLENLIQGLNSNYKLLQEPKREKDLGAPDFNAFTDSIKIGFIETKDLNKDVYEELKSDQIKRYKENLNNIILTNYYDFILIRNNDVFLECSLFSLNDLKKSNYIFSIDTFQKFTDLISTFFDYRITTITTASELALELSKRTKLLKDLAKEQLSKDFENIKKKEYVSSVYDFYKGIQKLITDIDINSCSDAYAQTITYGLFLAKINSPEDLDKNSAAAYIPSSIAIIKRMFQNIVASWLPSKMLSIIDEIIQILNFSNIKEIISELDLRGKKDKDPFTFFYEAFLSRYNPEKRKRLGVFYTPRPVVNFIVNYVNKFLKTDFGKTYGFGDDDVTVLDPAVGTGTFLWLTFILTLVDLKNSGLSGLINDKIRNHILKDFYGFEILITPYIISHLKLINDLKKWKYHFNKEDRIQVYLTNTLDIHKERKLTEYSPFMREIIQESEIANKLKSEKSILVIMGNPPYSVSSSNKAEWITEKMKDYKLGLKEKNIQPLDDDYIKFIRFAQWKIDQSKQGIISMITNNSFIDGIIHRKMREELLKSFNRIYILNLHGDSRKGETSPDGTKDENVFDIQQGVAISIFIKNNQMKERKVFYSDLYGTREYKYNQLDSYSQNISKAGIDNVRWQEIEPDSKYFFFKPIKKEEAYLDFISLKDIFCDFNAGVVTGLDSVLTDSEEIILSSRMKYILTSKEIPEYEEKLNNSAGKKILSKRLILQFDENNIKKYHYRPFDFRYVYYSPEIMERSRRNIIERLPEKNLILVISRINTKKKFDSAIITDCIPDYKLGESTRGSYLMPLYIYEKEKKGKTSKNSLKNTQLNVKPNFTDDFLRFIEKTYYKIDITPEDIMGYIYSILYHPSFRSKFDSSLKIDFPKIPFIKDCTVFKKLSEMGKELINFHLMKSKLSTSTIFDIVGTNEIQSINYKEDKLFINKTQFFGNITNDVWDFQIGGYQILNKWLKSRKKVQMKSNQIEYFNQIVEIIKKTINHMKKLDEINILEYL